VGKFRLLVIIKEIESRSRRRNREGKMFSRSVQGLRSSDIPNTAYTNYQLQQYSITVLRCDNWLSEQNYVL